jgi:putative endonuclease
MRLYYVYILASRSRVLYIGITRDLGTRLEWHRSGANPRSFVSQYKVTHLVYWEEFTDVRQAIARDEQLKGWRREKKVRLIESLNSDWQDLAPDFTPTLSGSEGEGPGGWERRKC